MLESGARRLYSAGLIPRSCCPCCESLLSNQEFSGKIEFGMLVETTTPKPVNRMNWRKAREAKGLGDVDDGRMRDPDHHRRFGRHLCTIRSSAKAG